MPYYILYSYNMYTVQKLLHELDIIIYIAIYNIIIYYNNTIYLRPFSFLRGGTESGAGGAIAPPEGMW